jgi:hypothetical protein
MSEPLVPDDVRETKRRENAERKARVDALNAKLDAERRAGSGELDRDAMKVASANMLAKSLWWLLLWAPLAAAVAAVGLAVPAIGIIAGIAAFVFYIRGLILFIPALKVRLGGTPD